MLPFVRVTWLPFCLTALKPNLLQRILISSLPFIGVSRFKPSASYYRFGGFVTQHREMEFERLFEVLPCLI